MPTVYHSPIPFLILTGYLGAGKTTVLNRLLSVRRERRLAVLINELGRIHIDRELVLRGDGGPDGDLLELSDGCICCRVDLQRDLWESLIDIVGRSQPDQLVLETTGIAEPAALLDGLARLPDTFPYRFATTVVCVVDGTVGLEQLETRAESRAQLLAADRVLLSKLDITAADALTALHRRLAELNPRAERASFPSGAAGDRALAAWLLSATAPMERPLADHASPHAHGQLVAATFTDVEAPLLAEPLRNLLSGLGDRLVRAKGFAWVHGEPRRVFVEKAARELTLTPQAPWGAAAPKTELVLIGDDLDEMALRRQLWGCRAAG